METLIAMADCIFCRVANHQKPEIIHFEDDEVLAFNDIHPKAPTHILIVPKSHVVSIAKLEEDESNLVAKMIYIAKQVASSQGLKGYKLVFNVGREGGQVIDHLHLHLLGGWAKPEDWKKPFTEKGEDL